MSRQLEGTGDLQTPDVTKVQAAAFSQAVGAALLIFGFEPKESVTIAVAAISTAILIFLPLADAAVRRGRAANATTIANARIAQASVKADLVLKSAEPLVVLRNELTAIKKRAGTDDDGSGENDDKTTDPSMGTPSGQGGDRTEDPHHHSTNEPES